MLLWITPLFAGLLLLSARREAGTPLIADRPRKGELPADAERELLSTLAELPPGTARSLLSDITRMGQALHGQLRRSGALPTRGTGAERAAHRLLRGRVGPGTASMPAWPDSRTSTSASPPSRPGWMDALRRCERSRDALVQRLLEAMTVLGQLQGQSVRPRPRSVGAVRLDRRASDRGGRPRRRRRGNRGTARHLAVRRGGKRTPVERRALPGRPFP